MFALQSRHTRQELLQSGGWSAAVSPQDIRGADRVDTASIDCNQAFICGRYNDPPGSSPFLTKGGSHAKVDRFLHSRTACSRHRSQFCLRRRKWTARKAATPIKHLVVIFQENVSFDHYFGTYPYATNPGASRFVAAPGHADRQWLAAARC